jgi:hypothetical protein
MLWKVMLKHLTRASTTGGIQDARTLSTSARIKSSLGGKRSVAKDRRHAVTYCGAMLGATTKA